MAAQASREVTRDERIFAVPKLAEGAQIQEETLKQELQLKIVDTMNEMIDLARKHRPDLPKIDRNNFSMTILDDGKAVVQSAGYIDTVKTREGEETLTIYGKDKKVVMG